MFVICLTPAGDLSAKISRVRAALFTEHGLTSSLALPPIVPLSFSAIRPYEPARTRIVLPEVLATAGARWINSTCFLPVEPSAAWELLRSRVEEVLRGAPPHVDGPVNGGHAFTDRGLFPLYPGFFLASEEPDAGERPEISATTRQVEHLSFAVGYLECIAIEPVRRTTCWWDGVYWESVWKKRLGRAVQHER